IYAKTLDPVPVCSLAPRQASNPEVEDLPDKNPSWHLPGSSLSLGPIHQANSAHPHPCSHPEDPTPETNTHSVWSRSTPSDIRPPEITFNRAYSDTYLVLQIWITALRPNVSPPGDSSPNLL
ncbi:hypothetical protein XENORESO_011146, partial [Xenotaenia resolanae]